MHDVVLVTGQEMPRPDPEAGHLLEALARIGRSATVRPWGPGTDWGAASLVVIRTTWDYSMRSAEFLDWAAAVEAKTRLVNPARVIAWNSHKRYLGELAAAGVPTIPTVLVLQGASEKERREVLARFAGEVVVKPAISAGSRGALRASAHAPGLELHLGALVDEGDALVQPFVPSIAEKGESSLVFFGGDFSHAVKKHPAPHDYRVQRVYGGHVLAHEPSRAELEAAVAALGEVEGPLAYARVDLVETAAGPSVMELELIEPELFLPYARDAADRFVAALMELT